MANFRAIHSVGSSLMTHLERSYPANLRAQHDLNFRLISSGEFAEGEDLTTPTLSLYLYRVSMNEHLRNRGAGLDPDAPAGPLSVDLHYMLTLWADTGLAEHTLLGWAMRELHKKPVLDISTLSREAGWERGDLIHFIPSELSHEDQMRIWDALSPSYRLSFAYVARVVRIDREEEEVEVETQPVVARRVEMGELIEEPEVVEWR